MVRGDEAAGSPRHVADDFNDQWRRKAVSTPFFTSLQPNQLKTYSFAPSTSRGDHSIHTSTAPARRANSTPFWIKNVFDCESKSMSGSAT